ncbi:MAG: metallophosphoesterase [Ignavibacteriae bacterium]|nr:metallophosphoesterase [Ignavibacteriota bacterium]
MRKSDIFILLTIAFIIYAGFNFFVFWHGFAALKMYPTLRLWYSVAYPVVSLSWITGRLLERQRITMLSSAMIWFGSFWLAALVYSLMIAIAYDLLRLVNAFIPFLPTQFTTPEANAALLVVSFVAVAMLIIGGAINAMFPRVRSLPLTIEKTPPALKSLTVVAVSDIHLGTIIRKGRLQRIVDLINSLHADLVLLPGDIVDEDIGPVIKQDLGGTLRNIQARLGVFATTGNHEYIGGVEPSCKYLNEHGIRLLRDEAITLADSIVLVGREDVSYNRTAHRRKSLDELLHGIDRTLPIILLDHQPFRLHEAEEHGVDLQLSGHTHHGQIWPLSLLTRKIFEVSWGYKRKGHTHIYVSCGVGSWGPPVRIGSTPEIMNIRLTFIERKQI